MIRKLSSLGAGCLVVEAGVVFVVGGDNTIGVVKVATIFPVETTEFEAPFILGDGQINA